MAGIGIITGLVGSFTTGLFGIANKHIERKANKDKYAHTERLWEHEAKLLTLQSQARVAETEQEVVLRSVEGSYSGLQASIQSQDVATSNAYKWAATLISLMRPFITLALLYVLIKSALEGIAATDLVQTLDLSNDQVLTNVVTDIYTLVDNNAALAVIFELASMAVAWWFGDRSFKRATQSSKLAGQVRAAGGNF